MFRITKGPSSGSFVQCLAKNYKNGSIVSIDMGKVGVVAAYCNPFCVCVCVVHCIGRHPSYTLNYTHTHTHTHTHTQWVRICCHNTDLVHVNGHDRTILVILAK